MACWIAAEDGSRSEKERQARGKKELAPPERDEAVEIESPMLVGAPGVRPELAQRRGTGRGSAEQRIEACSAWVREVRGVDPMLLDEGELVGDRALEAHEQEA